MDPKELLKKIMGPEAAEEILKQVPEGAQVGVIGPIEAGGRNLSGIDRGPKPMTEAIVDEMRLRFDAYRKTLSAETFPFKPGDLVTPRPGSNLKNTGEPAIVLEINPDAPPNIGGTGSDGDAVDMSNFRYGTRPQIRVLQYMHNPMAGGTYVRFWNEACDFVPWTGGDPASGSRN